jgi:putative methyltransferase (TIGR04325 family)
MSMRKFIPAGMRRYVRNLMAAPTYEAHPVVAPPQPAGPVAPIRVEDGRIYASFADAMRQCQAGYEDDELARVILAKTKIALTRELPDLFWDQGGGTFLAIPYAAAVMRQRPLRVLDFGGSYGFHGVLAQRRFPEFPLKWAVVESDAIARLGDAVATDGLRIFAEIDEALAWLGGIDVMHCSGTLQCVPSPKETLDRLVALNAPVMLWQRMALSLDQEVTLVQISSLGANGIGPLPPDFQDREVRYPVTFVPVRDFLDACFRSYRLVVKVQGQDPVTLNGHSVVFSDVYLFSQA